MVSMNVKIPIQIAQKMSDRGHLNPIWMSGFIREYLYADYEKEPLTVLVVNYTFKLDNNTHKLVKLHSIECGLPMNELIGRLLRKYY